MSDIVDELVASYEREGRPEGAEIYRQDDIRIRAAAEISRLRAMLPTRAIREPHMGNCRRPDQR